MKKTLIIGSIMAVSALGGASAAHADDTVSASANVSGGGAGAGVTIEHVRPLINQVRADAQAQIQSIRVQTRDFASTTREDIEGMRQDMHNATGTSKMDLKAQIEMRKQALAQERASSTEAIKQDALARATQVVSLSTTHLSQEIDRLSQIEAKINTRLDKFDAAGGSTAAARADLAIASTDMANASTSISAIASVDASTDVKTYAAAAKTAIDAAQSAIDSAQKALQQVVEDMEKIHVSATATSSTDAQ